MINRGTASVALAALILAVLGAACNGSTSSGTTNTSPIVMAELFPISGREAFVGQWFQHGAAAAVHDINNNGGVMGRPLNETLADTGGDPVDAVTAFHKLLLQNPTFMVGPSSLEIQGVVKLIDSAQLVDFMEGGTSQMDHMQYKYVFRTSASDTTLTAAMAYYAIQKGYKKAVMFFETTSDAADERDHVTKFYTANGGQILDTENLALHQSSYQTEVAKAFAFNPDVVFVKTDPQTGSTLFANMRAQGHLNVPLVSDDTGSTVDYAKAVGLDAASKYLVGVSGSPPSGPAWGHYLADYNAVWNTDKPLPLSENTYDAVVIAALAMTEAKTTDGKVWVDHILKVSNPPGTKCYIYADCVKLLNAGTKINFEGASGPDDFDQYHNTFGDWDITQFNADASSSTVVLHVPADAIAKYMAG
jgi:ABC-type branched-subunit amino acid transport system substrate-binding protein